MARPAGFEPAAFCSGGRRSIQLSYGRNTVDGVADNREGVRMDGAPGGI